MPNQGNILKLIAERTENGRSTSYDQLAEENDIDQVAACGYLKRLWRERLIEAIGPRPPRYKFRLTPGESLRDLRFKLTSRGKERLEWMEKREDWF